MDKKYLVFAALETMVVTLPLGLALAFVLPQVPDQDFGYVLWAMFSAAAAGALPLLLRAFRPVLSTWSPGLDEARVIRLAPAAYLVGFGLLLPLWYAAFAPEPGWSPWVRLAMIPGTAAAFALGYRFIALPSTWHQLRIRATKEGWEFLGSESDWRWRPEYYDEDWRWLFNAVRKRLTSASS